MHAGREVDRFYCRLIGVLVGHRVDGTVLAATLAVMALKLAASRHQRRGLLTTLCTPGKPLTSAVRLLNLAKEAWSRKHGAHNETARNKQPSRRASGPLDLLDHRLMTAVCCKQPDAVQQHHGSISQGGLTTASEDRNCCG